jgi:hypothetical protein
MGIMSLLKSMIELGVRGKISRILMKKPMLVVIMAALFYAVFASVATFPFVIHPASTITAPSDGDFAGSVAKYEALREGHADPLVVTRFPWISYPQGPQDNIGVDRVSFFSTAYLWVASHFLGAITAHSLLTFLGYTLTALITFGFVWKLTSSPLAGLIAGYIYGFCPIMFSLARSDMTYTQMWLFILPIWAFWSLVTEGITRRRWLVAVISIVPAIFWTPYYTLHILVVGATSLACSCVYLWRRGSRRGTFKVAAGSSFSWLIIVIAYRYIGLNTPSTIIPTRTLAQIYQQAAQPIMYLLPGQSSWGPKGNSLLVHLDPGAVGLNLYVGLTVLLLGAVAVSCLIIKKAPLGHGSAQREKLKIAAVMCGWVALACFLFSLPPTYKIGSLVVPMPSYLVTRAEPALRAGQRFVMPIMGCLAVLAGIGSWLILERFRGRMRLLITIVILIIVGLDLWALVPDSATTIPNYAELAVLKSLPTAPVAQYDNGSLLNEPAHMPCLLQHEYDKPLINDCGLGRSADLGVVLTLPLCTQISALQAIGTRYLILNSDDKETRSCLSQLGAAERIAANQGPFIIVVLNTDSLSLANHMKARLQLP